MTNITHSYSHKDFEGMPQFGYCELHCSRGYNQSVGVRGKGLWAELSLFSASSCREMLRGSASDWDGHETFHAETEVCAARVVQPRLEELQVTSLPRSFRDVEDKGRVKKLHRPELTSLPAILGGRDGCQVRESEERDCLSDSSFSGRLGRTSLAVEERAGRSEESSADRDHIAGTEVCQDQQTR